MGKRYRYGDAFGGTGLGLYEQGFMDALDKRLDKELGTHEARVSFVGTLAAGMAENGKDLSFSIGDPDTVLVVVMQGCNDAVLAKLIEVTGEHLRAVGFTAVSCGHDGRLMAL